MKSRRWITLSLLLIIVGVTFVVVDSAVYAPRFAAFYQEWNAWVLSNMDAVQPSPELYGLNSASFYVSMVLGTGGGMLVVIGACYVVIFFIGKMAKRYGYAKEPQEF